jgi:hypothetical protein
MTYGRSRRAGAVGLSDEFMTNREIGKRVFCSAQGVSARLRVVLRGGSAK